MKLTSAGIRNKDFAKGFRGFIQEEVEYFLEDVAAEWDQMQAQYSEMVKKVSELETKLRDYMSVEKAMQDTLTQSRETGNKAVENAHKEAQLIIQEAEMKAAQIVEKATADLMALKEQVIILKAKKDSVTSRLKILLSSELELIKALEVDEDRHSNDSQGNTSALSKEIEDIIKSLDSH